jgi:CubicO group peptidase (beta-lactamase class C family)
LAFDKEKTVMSQSMNLNVVSRILLRACIGLVAAACGTTTTAIAQTQASGVRAFMNEQIECERYVFSPGAFPRFHWQHEESVEREVGKFPLTATYYNASFEPVQSATAPGRYGAVIEGRTPAGFSVKRYVTLFCSAIEFDDYSKNVPLAMNNLPGYGISQQKWRRYAAQQERFSFGSMKFFPQHDPDAAVFLAGLNEIDTVNSLSDTPRLRDRQWWITLRRKLDSSSSAPIAPRAPKSDGTIASEFPVDTGASSQYDTTKIEALRTVCRNWAETSGVPHVTIVLHKGTIVFHEAFGTDDDGVPVTTESRMWMASITKLLTGTLLMQFVDQGLIDLDAPASRYLPELAGQTMPTIRQLLTHTTGLAFAGEWASDWNPALENQVAHVLPTVQQEERSFSYNRVGYAVAGKILERMTGRAVPALFRDYLFSPLGMASAYADNTYGGLYCTTTDLARLAEALLHKGSYRGCTLFSEASFEKMLPAKLPFGGNRLWGIGTSAMKGHGLSERAFGHGAASGTTLRIDPEKDLVIISARNTPGRRHDEFESALIERCTALVDRH